MFFKMGSSIGTLVSAVFYAICIVFRPKNFLKIIKTLPRDLRIIWFYFKINIHLIYLSKFNRTVPKLFRTTVEKYPKKVAFYFEEEEWTFEEVDNYTNKIANYFKSLGYKRGDDITLLMDSRPEYICLWLGLAKIGVITGFLNNNISSTESLVHAIKSCKSHSLIFSSGFKTVSENCSLVFPELKMFQFNDQSAELLNGAVDLKKKIGEASNSSVDFYIDKGISDDILVYIFTSGTTGLPKASIIRNMRFNFFYVLYHGLKITEKDIIYLPVPLYHTLGGILVVSQCLNRGASLVIRKKFSANNFWKDCEKYKCTASPYIGEMARYLLEAHGNSKKPRYKLEKMFGNGMKPSVWKKLVENFNIDKITEFYGSTEGSAGLFNLDATIGAVGYCPLYGDPFTPLILIKCDLSGNPVKNSGGFCEICGFNEPGLLICKISNSFPITKFHGYTDEESTKKKILNNVLKNGDVYFNTGDILIRDEYGYFYFKDRTGDTFRWKGENVSTNEVEGTLSTLTEGDVVVYGVEIPGSEGKAGMAAIVDVKKSLDLELFLEKCKSNLPPYSIPIFLRIVDEIPKTGTFKLQKNDIRLDGFNINKIKDNLYLLDPRLRKYVKITSELYNAIMNCEIKL